jgi:hypothetical protein
MDEGLVYLNEVWANKSLSRHVRPEADWTIHSCDEYRQQPLKTAVVTATAQFARKQNEAVMTIADVSRS